ncbi:cytochrome P450 [Hymenopellis radicata]|nr:cytochrome P450 [Hymenopellis radicata]
MEALNLSSLGYANVASILIGAFVAFFVFNERRRWKAYPPGPPADPLIGHLRSIPSLEKQPEIFRLWSKTYGSDVIYLEILGKKLVVLDSVEAATELLEKRSLNYSNRPTSAVFTLLGMDRTLAFLPYGKEFVLHRKLFQSYFGAKECRDLLPIQAQEALTFVKNFMANPKDCVPMLERFSGSIILRITYGYELKPKDDPVMAVIQKILDFSQNADISMTPLDIWPWLKYFPSWFPGAYWAGWARRNRHLTDDLYNVPFDVVHKQMREGTAKSSFVSAHLSHVDPDMADKEAYIEAIKLTAAQIYAAGAETTSSTLLIALLGLVLNPEVQRKAQIEIDKFLGRERLPTPDDRPDLPYIDYIIYETERWHPIVPFGVPHVSLEDDIYKGMLIPKGSMVVTNLTSMSLNEGVYTEPTQFNPDRFIPKSQGGAGEPILSPFGFGRRICPGRFMADNTLWITLALLLATCRFEKAKDAAGNEITPKAEFIVGTVRKLKPFPFELVPRTDKAAALLEQTQFH